MKALVVSNIDHCNMGYSISQALQKVGVNATATFRKYEAFRHPESGIQIVDEANLTPYAKEADIILFMHTAYRELGVDLSTKKVLVWHTGSGYRQKYTKYNRFFDRIVDVSLCGADVLGLGCKNERKLNGLTDVNLLQPIYERQGDKIIIAHYPSNPKGIEIIQEAIERLSPLSDSFIFKYDPQTVTWKKHIERVSECDIYISEMYEKQIKRGREYIVGLFGIAALEAAALGKVPISRFVFEEDCTEYPLGLQVANNADELTKLLTRLLSMSDEEFLNVRKRARDWVVNCHSLEAVGRRLLNIIEEI